MNSKLHITLIIIAGFCVPLLTALIAIFKRSLDPILFITSGAMVQYHGSGLIVLTLFSVIPFFFPASLFLRYSKLKETISIQESRGKKYSAISSFLFTLIGSLMLYGWVSFREYGPTSGGGASFDLLVVMIIGLPGILLLSVLGFLIGKIIGKVVSLKSR